MKVFVYGRVVKEQDRLVVKQLLEVLGQHQIIGTVYKPFLESIKEQGIKTDVQGISSYQELKETKPDYVITLGGDGTILSAMTLIKDLGIPILGINLGRLGFLANAEKSKITQALLKLKNGDFKILERTMLTLRSKKDLFGDCNSALNDFTVLKRDNSSMILIHCYINGELLNSYWADGLIVSTPTGSTSYSLSVGGPIITPDSGNFVISPVAPHNLNARPVVVSDDVEIKIKVEGRSESFLVTLDSRHNTISEEDELSLSKCSYSAKLVTLSNSSFFKTIHQKLNWGMDKRNS